MKKIIFFISFLLGLLLLISSCYPITTTTGEKKTNQGAIYNPYIQQLHPEFLAFNVSREKCRLYVKLSLAELMFAPIGPNKSPVSKIKIDYKVLPFDNYQTIADSGSIAIEVKKRKGETSAITFLSINDNNLNKYFLQITTVDLLKQTKAEEYVLIDKENVFGSQNFMINLKAINYPYFYNYANPNDTFEIQYNQATEKLYVRHFGMKLPLPNPPFSSLTRSEYLTYADTSWVVNGTGKFDLSTNRNGLYFIQADTTKKYGLGLLSPGANFPFIKSTVQMIEPLEYLLSTGEFNLLLQNDNKKLAVDNFWLSCGKSNNRSRELIRIYYNRTFYANVYFTSFTEGWKTDRGMIYIIFGPPKTVNKTPDKETWIYSDRINSKYLQFQFLKTHNPFSDNDFVLERHIDFKDFWFKAIESWRQGKVYNVFE